MSKRQRPDQAVIDLIKQSGDLNQSVAEAAQYELAQALQLPLRQGVLKGDVLMGIFERMDVEPGASTDYPLDILAPGTEDDFVAYTNPGNGRIPERQVEGDYIKIPTYMMASSIDWLLRFSREARYDVVARCMEILEAGFVQKRNNDGMHTILSAAADRNILVHDADATAGRFTKRLVSLLKTIMRRQAGGNTGSLTRGKMTDMLVSPEAVEDIRNWNIDQVDEMTRREIYLSGDDGNSLTRIFGVNLHDLDEFGQGQQYQEYYLNDLGASLAASDLELVVGLDLSADDSFVMPVKMDVSLFVDPALHRSQRAGMYGWMELGFAVLDNRRCILGSF